MHDEWALAESMAERLPTVLEQEWARWMIDGARLRMNDPDALRIFVTVSATHHAAVATDARAACQRVGVRVFASSATLSGCAAASCGSTSSR